MTGERAVAGAASRVTTGWRVCVHGSTSNLGSAFDVMGLAVDLDLVVEVVEAGAGTGAVEWHFDGTAPSGENAVARGYAAGLVAWGLASPHLSVRIATGIPMRAGLGSSAAAIVAGLRLAAAVSGVDDEPRLLNMAAHLEGHPDNVAASVLGGCVVSAVREDGHVIARRIPWPDDWRVVVATPPRVLATPEARAVLPADVPRGDAIFNLQRAALLVHAITAADEDALREALRDRLHQPHRAPLVPGLAEALREGVDGAFGVFLSGAGPTLAAIAPARESARVEHGFAALFAAKGERAAIRTLCVK